MRQQRQQELPAQRAQHVNPNKQRDRQDQRDQLGAYGERVALMYLEESGYLLEAKNWRGQRGELDLIMRRDTLLVIVEVRTTSTRWLERPAEATPLKKQRQVARCADEYLAQRHPRAPQVIDIRFDIIGVFTPSYTQFQGELSALPDHVELDHIEDAYHSPWAF